MNAANRLALWLVLAADAMFFIGLLGASRVMPHALDRAATVREIVAVGLLLAGRIVLRWRRISALATLLALAAMLLLVPMLRSPIDSQRLLHAVVVAHIVVLAPANFVLSAEINLLWEFVIVLGCLMLASSR